MKPVIIIQARLNSSRLPQKALKEVEGYPLLYYTFSRLKSLKSPKTLLLATTERKEDQALVNLSKKMGLFSFQGSEKNVLERFYLAALQYPSPIYVRITGDCPLVDPQLLDQMLTFFISKWPRYDYLSNTLDRSYPKGLDIEIFTFEALKKAYLCAQTEEEKEHVTMYIYQNKHLFSLYNFKDKDDFSKVNLSVDTLEDFQRVKKIIEMYHHQNPSFGLNEIKEYLLKMEIVSEPSPSFL